MQSEKIAVIGMACLLPGASNYRMFWKNIQQKKCFIEDAPDEWLGRRFAENSKDLDRIYTRRVGLLGDLAEFDPLAYGVVPNSIPSSEPDHFLALRMAAEALQDSGYDQRPFDRESTGVILGRGASPNRGTAMGLQSGLVIDQTTDIIHQLLPDIDEATMDRIRRALIDSLPAIPPEAGPGMVSNVAAGRIANRLDLQGPSYLVDAACSSTLIAVEQAMKELRSGSSRMMLAGGVQGSMPAQVYMLFCQMGALSRDMARPFDQAANGTILAEGAGFLVLKRLADAEADGDTIYAVLAGAGLASDGKAQGLLTPRLEGEALAVKRAYQQSGIDPNSVELIEAHGTGIKLGDSTELQALRQNFAPKANGLPTIALGSVKSMIGHCIPAAGIASLIKMILALRFKMLPPTLCEQPRKEFDDPDIPLYMNTESRPWIHGDRTQPRRAAVSAFGFGGINAHVLLEEYGGEAADHHSGYVWPHELLLFSAPSPEALSGVLQEVEEAFNANPALSLAGVAKALSQKPAETCRAAVLAEDGVDLVAKLNQIQARLQKGKKTRWQSRDGIVVDLETPDQPQGQTAFLFPGQGSQYVGMFAALAMAFPPVRHEFDLSDAAFRDRWEYPPSASLFPPPTGLSEAIRLELAQRFQGIDSGQETIVTANVIMFRLLKQFGIDCDVIVGHSTGEYSALAAAGAVADLTVDQQIALKHALNESHRSLEMVDRVPEGELLAVGNIEPEALKTALQAHEGRVFLAMDNCPSQKILFGFPDDIQALSDQFRAVGGLCQKLPFGRAYHTPHVAEIRDDLLDYYQQIPFQAPRTRLVSCATLGDFPANESGVRELAVQQWYSCVRFQEVIQKLFDEGVRHFIEVGPENNLTSFVDDILRKKGALALPANVREQSATDQLQRLLSRLWCRGFKLDFEPLYRYREVEPVDYRAASVATGVPAKKGRTQVLDLSIPTMSLPPELAREIREKIQPATASTEPSEQAASPAADQPPTDQPVAPAAEPSSETADAVALEHQRLMQEFLASQQRTLESLAQSLQTDPSPTDSGD